MPKTYHFSLAMPANHVLGWYQGQYRQILVTTREGLKLQLPASKLRPFITARGLYGSFQIRVHQQGKLLSLKKL